MTIGKKKPLIIIAGPTASGKTKASIELAKEIGGEIISADSAQVYRMMDIGSAKVTEEEMQGVKHHLIDILDPREEFNVFLFQEYCKKAMDEIYSRGKIPMIVGGTGFYIQAVLNDIDFTENDGDHTYRHELEEISKEEGGIDRLHDMLKEVDLASSEKIHKNNVKRVIRALEFFRETGKKISEHNEIESQKESPYDYRYFVLSMDRTHLYDRIDKRVDLMMEAGLLEEVTRLRNMGLTKDMVSMRALGYKEIFMYLEGEWTLEQAVSAIKQETRHFAKRQLTWFRREKNVIWVDTEKENLIDVFKIWHF